jgi:hypothetical protein
MSKLNELIKQRDALDAQINAVDKAETTGQIASQENNDKMDISLITRNTQRTFAHGLLLMALVDLYYF